MLACRFFVEAYRGAFWVTFLSPFNECCVSFGSLLGYFWLPWGSLGRLGVPRSILEVPWWVRGCPSRSLGDPRGYLGRTLSDPRDAIGVPWGSLGVPWSALGPPGKLLDQFWIPKNFQNLKSAYLKNIEKHWFSLHM